ncbi:MAG: nitrogenase component 1, partial [Myxococcales bacterium]|nr:nitrogenase component 1 [Myxococcales bacterium]
MSERILSSVPPFLDGVYLGTNAIPDAYLVIDCPSGCFGKCERIALNHDLGSTLFDPMGKHRIVQSGINFAELTMGSERALGQLLHSVVEKTQPKALIMTQATSALLTSNDLEALCLRYGAELELPIVYLPPQTLEGDYVDGYEAFLEALVEALLPPASEPRAALEGVSLVGFLVHRLEEDQRADLEELRRLVEALQLPLRGILLDGSPMETLAEALKAEALIELPHAGQAARRIAERTGARVLEAA